MPRMTITCPRCREDFATDADRGTAVCPSCGCRLLLKRRFDRPASLEPAAAPGVDDALGKKKEYAGDRPSAALETGEAALRQGDLLLQRNQFNQALYVFKNAAASAPDDYRAWWGVATATLQHLCAYLDGQKLLYNISPVQTVYDRQTAAAEKAMAQVRLLAPDSYIAILEDRYMYDSASVQKALKKARRACRHNAARRTNKPLRAVLFVLCAALIAGGVLSALYLPLDMTPRLVIGACAAALGVVSGVFAFRT